MINKKKVSIVIAVVLAVILLVPIPLFYKDGGTVEYKALVYSVTLLHSIAEKNVPGYNIGTVVEILGFTVHNDVEFVPNE